MKYQNYISNRRSIIVYLQNPRQPGII